MSFSFDCTRTLSSWISSQDSSFTLIPGPSPVFFPDPGTSGSNSGSYNDQHIHDPRPQYSPRPLRSFQEILHRSSFLFGTLETDGSKIRQEVGTSKGTPGRTLFRSSSPPRREHPGNRSHGTEVTYVQGPLIPRRVGRTRKWCGQRPPVSSRYLRDHIF